MSPRQARSSQALGRCRLIAAAAAMLLALALPSGGAAKVTTQSVLKAINGVWNADHHELIGMCAGAIDGDVRAISCHGLKALFPPQKANVNTLFAIASNTKTITATLLALRVKQGSVRLGDRVSNYLPAKDGADKLPSKLTLLDLVDHYSGLPRSPAPSPAASSGLGPDQLYSDASSCFVTPGCLTSTPGTKYLYSNFAFGVLGDLLGDHDGFKPKGFPLEQSAWEFDARRNVLGPLGLSEMGSLEHWQTCCAGAFGKRRAHAWGTYTDSHGNKAVGEPPMPSAGWPWMDPAGGGGSIFASSKDMMTWMRYSMGLIGPRKLRSAQRLLYDDTNYLRSIGTHGKVGLAWQMTISGGTTCVYKAGSVGGFTSYVIFVKGKRRGAFVLLNNDPSNPSTSDIGKQLINALPKAGTGPKPTCPSGNADQGGG